MSGIKEANLRRFAEAGFRLCRLGHKEPGWAFTDFTLPGKVPPLGFLKSKFTSTPDVSEFPKNYGVVLDAHHIVFDVDPRNFPEGRNSWKEFQEAHGVDLEKLCGFYVKTGGGGTHYYFKKPVQILVRNGLKEFPGVEFKSKGRQVVGPGSIHPDTLAPYELVGNPSDLFDCPMVVIEAVKREEQRLVEGLDGYDDSPENKDCTRQSLAQHPQAIAGQQGNTTTFQAACICRENGVSKEVALELLEEYNSRCEPPWTIDELYTFVNNAYRYAQNALGSRSIKTDFDVVQEEQPEEAPKKPEAPAKPTFIDDIEQNWAFSVGTKEFFRLSNMRSYDKEQFDDLHSGATEKKKPSAFAIMHPGMAKVELPTYWPGKPRFVEEDGEPKINLWSPAGISPLPGDVEIFKDFVNYLAGENAWIVHDFMAYILRNPGEKVLWAILLQGGFGVGKSLVARIFAKLVGHKNVSQPTNQIVHEKYNGWMRACQLVVVHELMAVGRLEMMNKLKDPITEPTITIREMFKPTYETVNRANFFFLTNFEDAIIIPKGDRRFAVIFSGAEKQNPSYYANIIKWMDTEGPGALLHYYLFEHKYDARFDAKGPAPMTESKQKMQAATLHPVQATIMDAFSDFEFPFHGVLANFSAIMDLVLNKHKHVTKIELTGHLKACGFEPVGERMRLKDGERGRLYAIRKLEMLRGLSDDRLKDIYVKQEEKHSQGVEFDLGAVDEQDRSETITKIR